MVAAAETWLNLSLQLAAKMMMTCPLLVLLVNGCLTSVVVAFVTE